MYSFLMRVICTIAVRHNRSYNETLILLVPTLFLFILYEGHVCFLSRNAVNDYNLLNETLTLFVLIIEVMYQDVTKRPPPNLPGGLGSEQYPLYHGYSPEKEAGISVAEQLKEGSLLRRSEEEAGMMKDIHPDARIQRQQSATTYRKNPYCCLCSETMTEVYPQIKPMYHKHLSSKLCRIEMPHDKYGQYLCTTCKITPHYYKAGARVALYISSSTMCNWQADFRLKGVYPGDPLHIDSLCIPGGSIKTLLHAFSAEYQRSRYPLDVLLCGGINNLLQGQTKEQVMTELASFKEYVVRLNPENTCAICTLIYPPILSQLEMDPPRENRRYFVDRTEDIYHINDYIVEMNGCGEWASCTRVAPQPHTFGLRIDPRGSNSGILGKINAHKLSAWRETVMEEKLHLADYQRLKIGRSFVKYFEHVYNIRPTPHLTRREAQEAYEASLRWCEQENERMKAAKTDARRSLMKNKESRLTKEILEDRAAERAAMIFRGEHLKAPK